MKNLGLTKSGQHQTRGVLGAATTALSPFAAIRSRKVSVPLMVLAIAGLTACAPKPEVVAAPECPPPVTSYAKDGTLITLSEPCVLPERFEIAEPVAGAAPIPQGEPGDQDNGGMFPGGNSDPGDGGGDPGDGGGDPGDGGGDPGDGGGGGGGKDFESKKEALQRVYGKEDWHNLEGNDYEAVRDYYLEHRKTDNNWINFKG